MQYPIAPSHGIGWHVNSDHMISPPSDIDGFDVCVFIADNPEENSSGFAVTFVPDAPEQFHIWGCRLDSEECWTASHESRSATYLAAIVAIASYVSEVKVSR